MALSASPPLGGFRWFSAFPRLERGNGEAGHCPSHSAHSIHAVGASLDAHHAEELCRVLSGGPGPEGREAPQGVQRGRLVSEGEGEDREIPLPCDGRPVQAHEPHHAFRPDQLLLRGAQGRQQ